MSRLLRTNLFVGLVAVFALALGGQRANAASWKVTNFKIDKELDDELEIQFDYTFDPDTPGDVVFLYVAAGQDEPVKLTGKSGHFKGIVSIKESKNAEKGTAGNRPIPILVYGCEVYTEKQARIWIKNRAAVESKIHTYYIK